jgi:hypothetical protein
VVQAAPGTGPAKLEVRELATDRLRGKPIELGSASIAGGEVALDGEGAGLWLCNDTLLQVYDVSRGRLRFEFSDLRTPRTRFDFLRMSASSRRLVVEVEGSPADGGVTTLRILDTHSLAPVGEPIHLGVHDIVRDAVFSEDEGAWSS